MASAAAAQAVRETAEAALVLLSLGCQVVVVTLGARGASAYFLDPSSSSSSQGEATGGSDEVESGARVDGGALRCVHQGAPKLSSIVDATGAGDAFAGGFLVRWVTLGARGGSGTSTMAGTERDPGRLCQALRAGCEMGAAATMTLGGSSSEQSCYQRAVDLYDDKP